MLDEGDWAKWETAERVLQPCYRASLPVAALILKDAAESPYVYLPAVKSRSLKRSPDGGSIEVREVELPVLPDKACLKLSQYISVTEAEDAVKVIFTTHESMEKEWKGTIEISATPAPETEGEVDKKPTVMLEFVYKLQSANAFDENQDGLLTAHAGAFLKSLATMADKVFFLTEKKIDQLLKPDNGIHVLHSVLDVAKRFHEIPPWLPLAAYGADPATSQPFYHAKLEPPPAQVVAEG